jgi:hypothetical protein
MSLLTIARNTAQMLGETSTVSVVLDLLDRRSDNRMAEQGMLSQAFHFCRINRLTGDYLEFGLWRGKTFAYARRMKKRYQLRSMKLWGFDSFQGLPAPPEHPDNIWRPGDFACSQDEFRRILRAKGFKPSEYELIPGYFHESLNEHAHSRLQGRTAAVVYIDCDLYDSTRDALRFVHRYLVNGTILCFDDFYAYKGSPNQGEQLALREFLDGHPDISVIPYLDFCPVGKSFIVRRSS